VRLVTVTVDEAHAGAIDEVAARLRDAGMDIDRVLGAIGVITGSVAASQIPLVEAAEGVASVEEQTSFKLPPPDAEVQ
jgi:hypothetical protein